ncbi:type IV toxin-antitoxin system AbiEi family antitoxin domain-containing protein [Undibacterium sp. 5I1]|uniref:type IV toxin-antitoxin system AbiEi family antitoxin domain-containing protein n=1 Tax=unclassified Undibacterium TaxID=2630295 RepID=UPI002AB4C6D9|nr:MULTISPECIES: type IV toxin-antitoxin system AbiEi family antitoxin domain-containing protein [unclassified Undibacterium]MDY7538760.1 type IV toxin-antitoxin system AbiEi family antitoxin domain-containing protein [Undibacterium sp. 5I1]MEB0229699.1 type IV toxin-antitoxin system AbiEi family antitoxin domain-containing protein [Undibacterium sp. 10I3]MEB0258436.1 type IV toxin-antitoxin system AbiEi family antitoxin domain-containing protein [Undibacterium sp. 5I1]
MSSNIKHSLIKELLIQLPHGQPFGLSELAAQGISPYLAAKYAKSGWLERLTQGTYAFPNDALQLDACLLFLQKQAPGLHVGGKTALSWQGIRHNVSSRPKLYLWGTQRYVLPEWFTSRFPARYYQRAIFNPDKLRSTVSNQGYANLADHAKGLFVSNRERALLEVLDEVGVSQDLEEAKNLFESFTSMRLDMVGALLVACSRVKTTRLFLHLAEQTKVVDVQLLRTQFNLHLGGDARWTRRLQDGTLLTLKNLC